MMMMNPSNSSYRSIHNTHKPIVEGNRPAYRPSEGAVPVRRSAAMAAMNRYGLKSLTALLLCLLLFTSFIIIHTNASPTHPAEPAAIEKVVTVGSGDTLWGIAKRHSDGSQDVGYVVYRIQERNQLASSTIRPGQRLIIPSL